VGVVVELYGGDSGLHGIFDPCWGREVHVALSQVNAIGGEIQGTLEKKSLGVRMEGWKTNLKMDQTSTANARPVRSREEKGMTDFMPFRAAAGAVAM
jgi:hypothetical protein